MTTPMVENTKQITEVVNKAADSFKEILAPMNDINAAITVLGKSLKDGTSGFEDIGTAAGHISKAMGSMGGTVGTLIATIPGLQGVGQGLSTAFTALGAMSNGLATVMSESTKDFINFSDAFSKPVRDLDKEMFNLTKSFGMGIQAAQDLTDSIPEQALTDFSRSMHLSTGELQSFLNSAKNLNLPMDTLTEKISTAYGSLDLYTVAAAQASAAGIGTSEMARLLETSIARQGTSAETATEIIAGFSEVARETGLSFSTVTSTLNSAVSGFNKLGMSADFGRPILENFAKTVKEVGLGVDAATESTSSLVSAMANLSDNYGLSYLTQIRGGGGATAGGVLGSSIEMRQNMREAESTGDQGSMAIEMAKQMRDTISSMTGGNIITLDQAAKSPDLQSQFYMQGQMLSQYGVKDTSTQDAVLDLLSKIDDASAMGDTQGQAELAEQLSREIDGRDSTNDLMLNLNTEIGSLTAQMFIHNRDLGEYTREIGAAAAVLAEKGASEVIATADEKLSGLGLTRQDAIDQKAALFDALEEFFGKLGVDIKPKTIADKTDDDNNKTLIESFKNALFEALKQPQVITVNPGPGWGDLLSVTSSGASVQTSPGTSP